MIHYMQEKRSIFGCCIFSIYWNRINDE